MNRVREKASGFTLLEILAATAMTAVLAGSLYATLRVAFHARRSAVETIGPVRKTELAVDLLRADIRSAVVPRGVLAGQFLGEDADDAFGRESDSLVLHCTAVGWSPDPQPGDVRRVELACEPADEGAGQVLVRRVTWNLLAPEVDDPPREVLCRGVHAFNLRYFDGADWQDSWDSGTLDNVLPLAVEVTLELQADTKGERDGAGYRTSRVFLIPCSSLTPGAPR